MTSVIGPLAAFVAVLLLIPLALWLLKRSGVGASASGAGGMRVVATLPLAPNQRLLTVEVGHGDERRWLVLGVSAAGIRTLHSMPAQPPTEVPPAPGLPSFAQLLQRSPQAKPDDDHGR